MRKSVLRPTSALLVTLALVGSAVAQHPGRRGGFGGPGGRGGPSSVLAGVGAQLVGQALVEQPVQRAAVQVDVAGQVEP